ncbi:MAG: DNRLRE domain-containing protein [Nanoarchaeota archaeon]|nr:DNRLRE domain-containing protein [Nanoarchaeota archaeon]
MNLKKILLYPLLIGALTLSCSKKEGPTAPSENHDPIIEMVTANPSQINSGDPTTLECIAEDPDGDSLVYNWDSGGGSLDNITKKEVNWTSPSGLGLDSTYVINVGVYDNRGGSTSGNVSVLVKKIDDPLNQNPIIQEITASDSCIYSGDSVTLECIAEDPDGDPLSYLWFCEEGFFYQMFEKEVTWESPSELTLDSYVKINVGVFDGNGGSASKYDSILVKTRYDTILVSDDSFVCGSLPNDIMGVLYPLELRLGDFWSTNLGNEPYFRFTDLDSGKNIRSAKIRLSLTESSSSYEEELHCYLHELLEEWNGVTLLGSNKPAWNMLPVQYVIIPTIPQIGYNQNTFYMEGEGITNMVRDWINNPSSNYGFKISPIEGSEEGKLFYSIERAEELNINDAPALVLEY